MRETPPSPNGWLRGALFAPQKFLRFPTCVRQQDPHGSYVQSNLNIRTQLAKNVCTVDPRLTHSSQYVLSINALFYFNVLFAIRTRISVYVLRLTFLFSFYVLRSTYFISIYVLCGMHCVLECALCTLAAMMEGRWQKCF